MATSRVEKLLLTMDHLMRDRSTPSWYLPAHNAKAFWTSEGCYISEVFNNAENPDYSLAIARVPVGVTTQLHRLIQTTERYVIQSGTGVVEVGSESQQVDTGDSVLIAPSMTQRITNTGEVDLVFYCICMPRFTPKCYQGLSAPVAEP